MKILWKTNIILPIIAESMSVDKTFIGGWLVGLSDALLRTKGIELAICFPNGNNGFIKGQVKNLLYYGFPEKNTDPSVYDQSIEPYLKQIIEDFKPDLLHIFGTEFPHTLTITKVFNKPNKTLINIQGLTSIYANLYSNGLPNYVRQRYSFRDFIKNDNIVNQEKLFRIRGEFEKAAIKNVNHVIGRTDWDEACSLQINPNRKYYFCNETLRDTFYNHQWDVRKIERHSIFLTQAHYPIKGLHFVLQILPNIIQKYPNAMLYISGENILRGTSFKDRLKQTYYAKYIKRMIMHKNLDKHIVFLGNLNEHQVANRLLKSHVFVSPSTIENESNSLSEAKLIGCPSIVSYVGGVTNRIDHGIDGFLYPLNEPYMMDFYISKIFEDDFLATKISSQSILNAQQLLNKEKNLNQIITIYQSIFNL